MSWKVGDKPRPIPYTTKDREHIVDLCESLTDDLRILRHIIYSHNQNPSLCDKLEKYLITIREIREEFGYSSIYYIEPVSISASVKSGK